MGERDINVAAVSCADGVRGGAARAADDPRGEIVVSLLNTHTICCEARGHLRVEHVLAAQREMEQHIDAARHAWHLLFVGLEIESYEPGSPFRWVRWITAHRRRLRRTAVVGRPGPMLAVAATFRYLLPGLPTAAFADRDAAVEFLGVGTDGVATNRR